MTHSFPTRRSPDLNVADAAAAISQGVEMDFRWLTPLRFLNVSGSLGLLDAHYDSYPDGQATAMMPSGSKQDLSGRTLSFAPKVTASLTPTVTLPLRSEEHTSELQSLMRISYAVFCLTKQPNHISPTIRFHQPLSSLLFLISINTRRSPR